MQDRILPIGSVVTIKDGNLPLLIISRADLFENNGELGYFDYSAVIYPEGMTEGDKPISRHIGNLLINLREVNYSYKNEFLSLGVLLRYAFLCYNNRNHYDKQAIKSS